jgi:ribosome modulation factor
MSAVPGTCRVENQNQREATVTDRDFSNCSQLWRQGYSAGRNGRKAHENPYLGKADLASMYASRQWIEGWREAEGDRAARRTVRRTINEMSQEIADEIKRS